METHNLHVLMLPSWYPTNEMPLHGIFFKEQASVLHRCGVRVGVVYPELRSLLKLNLPELRRNCFQSGVYDEEDIVTWRFHGWNIFPFFGMRGRLWIRMALALMDRYIRKFGKPDLIHAHGALWGGAAAAVISEKYGIPFIVTEHSSNFFKGHVSLAQKARVQKVFKSARLLLTVSSALGRFLFEQGLVELERVRVLPNLVDEEFFSLPLARPDPSVFHLLTVCCLTPFKGVDVLLKAFAQMVHQVPDMKLEIAGDGPERRKLERLARQLKLESKVKFSGVLNRVQLRDALWRSHLLVHPSFYETFGIILIEAQATGLPVVATACGGPEDIVTPETGVLVPVKDVDALMNAILETRKNYGKFDPHSIRRHAIDRFGSKNVSERLMACYKEALK